MKHLDRSTQHPRGLRRLLRPGPPPWFHRSRTGAPAPRSGREAGTAAAERDVHGPDFQALVALYGRTLQLHDRARTETHVAEDALSIGEDLKASQHFSFRDHYRRRAEELEAATRRRVAALKQAHDGCRLAAEAMRVARERLYGTPEVENRPEFV